MIYHRLKRCSGQSAELMLDRYPSVPAHYPDGSGQSSLDDQ